MKRIWREILCSLFMGAVLPWIILSICTGIMNHQDESAPIAIASVERPMLTYVSVRFDEEIKQMELESYLTGVVLAEMPGWFEEEALKAQAVAARTYTRKALSTGGKHGDGSICTDSSCCQAYISEEAYLESNPSEYLEKVSRAVAATAGEVVTYQGELIEATYFSCSGGTTEDAAAVWGTDYPYLKSVDSPGEEKAAYFRDQKTFTREQLEALLDIELPISSTEWFSSIALTPGGGVASVEIGDKVFTGTELRRALGLRSTAFQIMLSENTVTIETMGYGHRVGFSQYGADAMAVAGKTYQEIITYYYQGTKVEKWQNEQ